MAALLVGGLCWTPVEAQQPIPLSIDLSEARDVPAEAVGIVEVSIGRDQAIALKGDGQVLAWGYDQFRKGSVPAGVSRGLSVAAGCSFDVVVRADGTVAAWGYDPDGATNVPAGLINIAAVSAQGDHVLALQSDRTVVGWGDDYFAESTVPFGLFDVVAIAAGASHSLALKADGSVVAWGNNGQGQCDVPAGLGRVVAISAGYDHSVALRADGTVVGWGGDNYGQSDVPAGLGDVVAISAGDSQTIVLKSDGQLESWGYSKNLIPADLPPITGLGDHGGFAIPGDAAPHFTIQPWDRSVEEGSNVTMSAKAVGAQPISYQWRFQGVDIAGATRDTFTLPSVGITNSGVYTLALANAFGTTVSRAVTVQVSPKHNHAPLLEDQMDRTINVVTSLVVSNAALDFDGGDHLSYQLTEAPSGASIGPDGVIRWQPSAGYVPSDNTFTTVATDDGTPPLSGTNSFRVHVLDQSHTGPVGITAGPIIYAANHHQYFLLDPASWTDAEATAVAMGGHLVTVNDQEEHRWLYRTFSSYDGIDRALWIGLTDPDPSMSPNTDGWMNHFVWSSGMPITFFCWSGSGQTNYGAGRIKMCKPDPLWKFGQGEWAEEADWVQLNGVAEIPLALEIVSQPKSVSVGIGRDVTLSVVADSTAPIEYQWQFMGTNLPGETDSSLYLSNAQPWQAGIYNVVVHNACGWLTSSNAVLSVAGIVGWGMSPFGVFDVPSSATNIVALSGGDIHALALRADGTVVGWGDDRDGQIDIPAGLNDAVAVAADGAFSLAVRADGTVIKWGDNTNSALAVPPGLANVVSVAADSTHCLALKADGTVVSWGPETNVPPGLSNVTAVATGGTHDLLLMADGTVEEWGNYGWDSNRGDIPVFVPADLKHAIAIAAGFGFSMALRADGTVVTWGDSLLHSFAVPPGLSNVVAIAAGDEHCLALKTDGRVVAWGQVIGNVAQPPNLANVVAIAAGRYFSLALLRDGAPHVTVQPKDRSVDPGAEVSFTAKAVGMQSMTYQWQFNGKAIPGATGDTYAIQSAQVSDSGNYALDVANAIGESTSRQAKLRVGPALPVNQPPSLPSQPDQTISELDELVVTNTAVDGESPNAAITYELLGPPPGMTIDSAGIIRWRPTEAQGPSTDVVTTVATDDGNPPLSATNQFTVVVLEQNSAPRLSIVPQQTVSALSELIITNAAGDSDIPANRLSYELANPPAGATIDGNGVVHWTPARTQAPSTNTLATIVTDDGDPPLSASNSFVVVVSAPALSPLEDYRVSAGQIVLFTCSATDNDPARKLTFELVAAPAGAELDTHTGVFTWRPPLQSAGTTNRVEVSVTDDSTPPVSDTRACAIVVNALESVLLGSSEATNGQYRFTVNGPAGPDYILEVSEDLANWSAVQTNHPATLPFDFIDPAPVADAPRFFRVRLGP